MQRLSWPHRRLPGRGGAGAHGSNDPAGYDLIVNDAWCVVQRAGHTALGLIGDSFHTLSVDDDPAGIAQVPGHRLFFIQLADAPRLTMGNRVFDSYDAVVSACSDAWSSLIATRPWAQINQ